jgi:hypothetical protein
MITRWNRRWSVAVRQDQEQFKDPMIPRRGWATTTAAATRRIKGDGRRNRVTGRPSVRVQQQTELDTKETSGKILCWVFASRSNYHFGFHFLDKSKPHSHSDSHLTKTLRNFYNYPSSAPPDTLRQENTGNAICVIEYDT